MIDRHSATWRAVKAFCQDHKDSAVRDLIEGGDHDERLRGRIELIEELLKLPDSGPPPVVQTDTYT